MRRRLFAICSVFVAAIVLVAMVPGCDGGPTTGTIEVNATLNGDPWGGPLEYEISGPGGYIIGDSIPSSYIEIEANDWTCAYVSGGPPEQDLIDITPSPTQSLPAGGSISFTFVFETPKQVDASIEITTWTINGTPVDPGWYLVEPGDWIGIQCTVLVSGEEDAVVTVYQT